MLWSGALPFQLQAITPVSDPSAHSEPRSEPLIAAIFHVPLAIADHIGDVLDRSIKLIAAARSKEAVPKSHAHHASTPVGAPLRWLIFTRNAYRDLVHRDSESLVNDDGNYMVEMAMVGVQEDISIAMHAVNTSDACRQFHLP